MRVKLFTTMAGPKGAHAAGEIVDLDQAAAYDLCERGYAEQVADAAPAATATAPAPETATAAPQRGGRTRGGGRKSPPAPDGGA